ncbi:MAG: response regulator [Lachnospiraceae bacterium]|nr:response regulator [Lachnospiraceae bacterium]
MNKIRTDRFVITVITIACIACITENYLMDWEFWVPPLLLAGAVALWVMHITQKMEERYRQNLYLVYGMMIAFYHGVHETSFFDVAVVSILLLILFSMMDRTFMMNLILAEFVLVMGIQIHLAGMNETMAFDALNISRILLHFGIVLCVYVFCRVTIRNRIESAELLAKSAAQMQANDSDMEDFLSNISHELRTPVNVVNGMSTLLSKRENGEEIAAIGSAGARLSFQIGDIQDFTEVKRGAVALEEENYMCTSLINDVVTGFRLHEKQDELELVVDLDPRVPNVMMGDIKKLHKIFRHLVMNALKFTHRGGVYIKVHAIQRDYGVNLCVEVTDTGIGMSRKEIAAVSAGSYQAHKERNRSTGGIGLGLPIVYGFVHRMGGFVKIESELGMGTTVLVTIPQKVVDHAPCLRVGNMNTGDVLFHVHSEKYDVPQVREFYRNMAIHMADGLGLALYSADNRTEIERLIEKQKISYIFMGEEEYTDDPVYFEGLIKQGIVIAVSAHNGFRPAGNSKVIVMPKPLYGFPVAKILNEGPQAVDIEADESLRKPMFDGVKALIVDDEPMNLVVATGLFRDYRMSTDTAESGKDALAKYAENDYDVIFMDHMMPEMDGVECMKRLRKLARERGKVPRIVALTANAVSGAREMFIREGFDGFIAKPIDLLDFERVMKRVLPEEYITYEDNTPKGGTVL